MDGLIDCQELLFTLTFILHLWLQSKSVLNKNVGFSILHKCSEVKGIENRHKKDFARAIWMGGMCLSVCLSVLRKKVE
jgi:hypothetical protein